MNYAIKNSFKIFVNDFVYILGEKELIQVTTEDGKYHFGPLDSLLTYELHAEKESYILSGPDDNGDFQAHKLAEIKVKVVDNANMKTLQVSCYYYIFIITTFLICSFNF